MVRYIVFEKQEVINSVKPKQNGTTLSISNTLFTLKYGFISEINTKLLQDCIQGSLKSRSASRKKLGNYSLSTLA